jgi:hypothetical protein
VPIFRVEIAGVPVEIRCRFSETEAFLKDFRTDKEPLLSIEPKESDLSKIQEGFDFLCRRAGFEPVQKTDVALENSAIHTLLAETLTEFDVIAMHGSALSMDGEAYVFTAKSGTGKSTHARLWREVFGNRVWMVNDDKPMLKVAEEGVTVYGSPWKGKHGLGRNASAPLKAIVKLERDAENRITPLSAADAYPTLFGQCFSSEKPVVARRIAEMEKRILNTVPFYKLGCNMDPEAAKIAYEGMNQGQDR